MFEKNLSDSMGRNTAQNGPSGGDSQDQNARSSSRKSFEIQRRQASSMRPSPLPSPMLSSTSPMVKSGQVLSLHTVSPNINVTSNFNQKTSFASHMTSQNPIFSSILVNEALPNFQPKNVDFSPNEENFGGSILENSTQQPLTTSYLSNLLSKSLQTSQLL